MKIRSISLATVMLGVLSSAAYADVVVHDAYSFATAPGAKTGAVFASIESDAADRLIGAETFITPRAELHTHENAAGIMKMRRTDGFDIAAGAPLYLVPGGSHIMLMDLPKALAQDETFPLTLVFEKAGRVETTVTVRAAGDAMPVHDHAAEHGQTGHAH